jgi:hypothetical protein
MPVDAAGAIMPFGRKPRSRQGVTAPGQVPLSGGRYVRFCGDTAAHVAIGTTAQHQATTADEYVPAGMDYWVDPEGAQALNFIADSSVWTPASLGSRLVAWWEAGDLSTLFQDTGGSAPVTADGQPVRRINDKSGNGFHQLATGAALSQTIYHSGTNPKITVSPATGDVRFTTSNSTITVADGSGQHTIGFAGKFGSTNGQILISLWDGGAANMGFLQVLSGGTVQNVGHTTAGGSVPDSCAAIDTVQPHVLTGRLTFAAGNSTSEAYNDGVSDGSSTFGVTLATTAVPMSLFDTPGNGVQFGGDFFAAVIVSGALTDAEHSSLVTYLGSKCGRTL